jgi:TRAP transporter TAXI family solute receptor
MSIRFRSAVAALVLAGLSASSARADDFINVLTGGTSGVYYPMGVALSNLFSAKIKGVRPTVQATKASVENLTLLQQGKGEIAFTLGDSLAFAWAGDEEAGFKGKQTKLRGVGAIYPNYIQLVASKASGIKTLADLKGKSLSVGAPKSGTELNTRAILQAAVMTYKDMSRIEYLPFGESVDLIKNRQLDVTLQSAGLGVAAIRDLASSQEIVVVEIPAAIVDKIGAPYVKGIIPKNTYTGQTEDVATAAVINYLVTRSDLSDDLVYQMTKVTYESVPDLKAAASAAADISLAKALDGMPVPTHPGAEKYFREKGVLK